MRGILLAAIVVFAASPAVAQEATQKQLLDWCYSDTATDDQTVQGCTAAIATGQYSGSDLSHLYNNRADGYIGKNEYNLAIQDDTQAIALDASNAQAYNNRCISYRNTGSYDMAITDCTQALALKPDYAHAFNNRAAAYEKKGQNDLAIADYRASLKVSPGDSTASDGLKRLGATP
jgi:tetratricopeptide (TPR) repeat protein